jgi:hypothetical protein
VPLKITRIPQSYRAGLAKIKSLSPEAVGALANALGVAQISDFAKLSSVVESTALVSPDEAATIVTSLRSLYYIKAMAETATSDLVAMLMTAMQMTGGNVALSEPEKPAFAEKLTQLLSIGRIERSGKIEQLKTDYQNILEDAKILTDLRPVFDKPGDRPVGFIVTHTLKIVTHESGEHKELFFALDRDDVLTLKRTAERALEKMASLQDFIKSTNLENLT